MFHRAYIVKKFNSYDDLACALFYRIFSQDIPADVVVEVGEANFSLHKVLQSSLHSDHFCVDNELMFEFMSMLSSMKISLLLTVHASGQEQPD